MREWMADRLRHVAVQLEGAYTPLPPVEVNTLDGELNLLLVQGSWLPEDDVAVVSGDCASVVIRGSDCETLYRVTLSQATEDS